MTPNGFVAALPLQPRIWDATRLAIAATCARKHYYSTVRGLRRNGTPSVHLQWGTAYHACVEHYDRAILEGLGPEAAKGAALNLAELNAIGYEWGETIQSWRCTDPELVKAKRVKIWRNAVTGEITDTPPPFVDSSVIWQLTPKLIENRSRCRFAKHWHLVLDNPPEMCKECGRPIELGTSTVPYHPKKTGETLLRAVETYCDSATSLMPYRFPGGKPALEVQARLPLPMYPLGFPLEYESGDDHCINHLPLEPYELVVNIDSLVLWDDVVAIRERKTTGLHINSPKVASKFWAQFDPNTQIDTYDLVGSVLYATDGIAPRVLVEVLCIADPEAPFVERREIYIPESRRAEWFEELQDLILKMERYAAKGLRIGEKAFPRNTTACRTAYGLCPFWELCTAAPSEREALIDASYHVERWDPEQCEESDDEPRNE